MPAPVALLALASRLGIIKPAAQLARVGIKRLKGLINSRLEAKRSGNRLKSGKKFSPPHADRERAKELKRLKFEQKGNRADLKKIETDRTKLRKKLVKRTADRAKADAASKNKKVNTGLSIKKGK